MSFKISNAAYLFDSDGSTVLVAKNIKALDGKTSVNRTGALRTSLQGGYVNSVLQSFHQFQGTNAAFTVGGFPSLTGLINKYPFASDANATEVGSMGHKWQSGTSSLASETHGYLAGASVPGTTYDYQYDIFKFPFAATSVTRGETGGKLLLALNAPNASPRYYPVLARSGASSYTHGYVAGANTNPYAYETYNIQKFPFSIESGNSSIIGNLSTGRYYGAGHTSSTHGYTSGGTKPSTPYHLRVIDKYSFVSDGNATNVGNLHPIGYYQHAGQSSTTDGFSTGGGPYNPNHLGFIQKFSFASDGDGANVGSLITNKYYVTGSSSTTHGYANGGRVVPFAYITDIEKFPYAISSGSATDVGDLTSAVGDTTSTQD